MSKPYVGRTFLVRPLPKGKDPTTSGLALAPASIFRKTEANNKYYNLYRTKGCPEFPHTRADGKKNVKKLRPKQLGQAVLVLDEGVNRVKVYTASGDVGWIKRSHLGEEVRSQGETDKALLGSALEKLLSIQQKLNAKPKEHISPFEKEISGQLHIIGEELRRAIEGDAECRQKRETNQNTSHS